MKLVGVFHLGIKYDIGNWLSNRGCGIFRCQEERDPDPAKGVKSHTYHDRYGLICNSYNTHLGRYIVVSESIFLVLERDIKNIAKLLTYATIQSLERIKRNLDQPDTVTFYWRKTEGQKEAWTFKAIMENGNECINMITKYMKLLGVHVQKNYEKKRRILESEVSEKAVRDTDVSALLDRIAAKESDLATLVTGGKVKELMELYQKAIEYYSAVNNQSFEEFLNRLTTLLKREDVQLAMNSPDDHPIQKGGEPKKEESKGMFMFKEEDLQEEGSAP